MSSSTTRRYTGKAHNVFSCKILPQIDRWQVASVIHAMLHGIQQPMELTRIRAKELRPTLSFNRYTLKTHVIISFNIGYTIGSLALNTSTDGQFLNRLYCQFLDFLTAVSGHLFLMVNSIRTCEGRKNTMIVSHSRHVLLGELAAHQNFQT